MEENSNLTCEDCGKHDATVEKGECPYAADVNNTSQECVLCPNCYHERVMDI